MTDCDDLARVPEPPAPSAWRRYLQTVAHLRPEQMARLVARRALSRLIPEMLPAVRATPAPREPWTCRAAFLDDPASAGFRPEARTLRLLQIKTTLADPVDWSAAGMPRLWQLELNYFHWMPTALPWVQARPWVVDWLGHAPRNLRSESWNPFGVAQRVLRWTRLIRGPWWEEIGSDPIVPDLLGALHGQCRFLARHQEKELLGNHLIKTASALYAGGRFFGGAEADRWLRTATRILRQQIREQVLGDGGHYERSPMYHLFVLVDLLDALNITPPGDPFEAVLLQPIARMSRFADACALGDGEIPLFNDSVLDHAPRRADVLGYAERLGAFEPSGDRGGFAAFADFGLFRLGDGDNLLWLDAGPTGPPFLQAHAHADTGSFELSVGPVRVVADSGVFSYQDRTHRAWDRSTPAHNTVSVAGASSSDCWASFRVARRARITALDWSPRDGEQSVTLHHDGFRHLPGSPEHERTVSYRAGVYTIRDRISRSRPRPLRSDGFLYLGPGVTVCARERSPETPRRWSFDLRIAAIPELPFRIDVSFAGTVADCAVVVEPAELAPRFHTRVPGTRIRAAGVAVALEMGIEWRLAIGEGGRSVLKPPWP